MGANHRQYLVPILWVVLLGLLVAGPWLLPGFVFGTDFAGPRHYRLPDGLVSYAGLQIALAVVGSLVPAQVVGKILILTALAGAGLSAYTSLPTGGFAPRAVASVVYMFNPFVYDRLAYGQLTVLAGYAVLPYVASTVRGLLLQPTAKRAMVVAGGLTIIAILDIHMALIATFLSAVLILAHVLLNAGRRAYLGRLAGHLLLTTVAALAANSYWLAPLLVGRGVEAGTLANIGEGDLRVFSTTSDPTFGLLPNVLGLYGFWAEATGRFGSLKEYVVAWPALLSFLVVLAAVGAAAVLLKVLALDFESQRAWVLGLLVAGVVAAVLDVGVSSPYVAPLVHWLDWILPPYRGMRDASKWASVLALVYAQLIPMGMMAWLGWTKRRISTGPGRESVAAFTIALFLALPLYYGNGLLYGMHGQIRPSNYPAGWYEADRVLTSDPHPGRAVFLPWHGYLSLSFVANSNRVVANPAPQFFSIQVIASQDLEIPGIHSPEDADQAMLSSLDAAGAQGDWAATLAQLGFKYVLVAREVDWARYTFLDRQKGFTLVGDFGSIVLYRNLLWQ